jgi:hypothetical protein
MAIPLGMLGIWGLNYLGGRYAQNQEQSKLQQMIEQQQQQLQQAAGQPHQPTTLLPGAHDPAGLVSRMQPAQEATRLYSSDPAEVQRGMVDMALLAPPQQRASMLNQIMQQVQQRQQFAQEQQAAQQAAIQEQAQQRQKGTVDLRKEYEKNLMPFATIQRAAEQAYSGLQGGGGMDAIAQAVNFFKVIDPTSVVREGEAIQVTKESGLAPTLLRSLNRALRGEGGFDAKSRQALGDAINRQLEGRYKSALRQREFYTTRAQQGQLDPGAVMGGLGIQWQQPQAPIIPGADLPLQPLPPGAKTTKEQRRGMLGRLWEEMMGEQ